MPVWNPETTSWLRQPDELNALRCQVSPYGQNGSRTSINGFINPTWQSQQYSISYPHILSQGSHDIPTMPWEHSPFDGLDMSNAPSGLDTGSPNDLDPHNSLDVVSRETIQAASAKILRATGHTEDEVRRITEGVDNQNFFIGAIRYGLRRHFGDCKYDESSHDSGQ